MVNYGHSCLYRLRGNLSHSRSLLLGSGVPFSKISITTESTGSALWAFAISAVSNGGDGVTRAIGLLDKASACWLVVPRNFIDCAVMILCFIFVDSKQP